MGTKAGRTRRAFRAGTALTLVSLFAGGATAYAQTGAANAPQAQAPTDNSVIVITGVRQSQRSSIDRKKRAKTASDSIVAEDVGKFPDKNIGEAISRIAGVALDRGDYNEGSEVQLRGATSGQTNVEIDGLGVQNTTTTNNLAFGGTADGRGKQFQEFPADLIQSVDVVKGSTASMTEGGLGGSIIIKSRTALDFKKPFFSLRFDMTQNSLRQHWTPEFNIIATRKFFNDRLGILLNYSDSYVENDNNAVQNATSGSMGEARGNYPAGSGAVTGQAAFDFDNSAEKTFTFNPATLSTTDPAATTVFANSTETPLSLLTKSAAAKTKADCYAAFPLLTGASAATVQRTQELQTCLNQWNDYSPSLIRYFARRNYEHRQSLDLRADFRVNSDLTVFAKLNMNKRLVNDDQLTFTQGNINVNTASVSTPTFNGVPFTETAGVRSAVAGSGYYVYDGLTLSNSSNGNGVKNAVVNVIPDSTLIVDKTHHVIQATITDGNINTDQLHNQNNISSSYISMGGDFHHDRLKASLLLGDAKSKYTRFDMRTNLNYTYGQALLKLDPASGLWGYTLPGTLDQSNPALYSIVRPGTATIAAATAGGSGGLVIYSTPAYTVAQQPWTSNTVGLQLSPKENDTHDKTAKFDVEYDSGNQIPFITSIQFGAQARDSEQKGWTGAGRTVSPENTHGGSTPFGTAGYIPAVVVTSGNLRGTFRACEPKYGTAGTAAPAGAQSCNYGYVANNNLSTNNYGTFTVNQADFQNIVSQVFIPATNQFFHGYPDRGNLFDGWNQIDIQKLYNLVSAESQKPQYSAGGDPLQHYGFACLKTCKGSDGKMYDMPFNYANEKTTAAYFQIEFEHDLPWNMQFSGNIGERMVKTDVEGSGLISLTAVRCLATVVVCDSTTATSNTVSVTANANVSVSSHTTDWLPSYNYNLWLVRDKLLFRYYAARVIARPGITRLLPAGTCTFDQRFDGVGDDRCTTFGNPNLKPFNSRNHNWSLEYYPDKDTQFSYGVFKNQIITGDVISQGVTGGKLLAGTGAVDPITGRSVENDTYSYTTFVNGPGFTRRGVEYAVKMSFSWLPWYLRYTGLDANYSKIHADNFVAVLDPISGSPVPPAQESSYYGNMSLWYDDGKTNARLAYQARDAFFECIASCGANTANMYVGNGYSNIRLPYNPGFPNFRAKTGYLDFKISHKLRSGFEVFFQANNITSEHTQKDQGKFNPYDSGVPSILEVGYAGYRLTTGFTFRH